MKLKIFTGVEIIALRRKLGLNQSKFWAPFQTTQSGGCRYESCPAIPDPRMVQLNLAFGSDAKAAAIFDRNARQAPVLQAGEG